MKNKKEIGIIGYGRFGKLVVKYLKEDFKLFIYDNKSQPNGSKKQTSIIFTSIEEASSKEIVILTVPISSLADVLIKIKDHVKKGCVIIDVCSVKEYPVKLMKKFLPGNVQILGTHPLFGPDSASVSLKGKKIILCPVAIDEKKYNSILKYLYKKELLLIKTTPTEHDKQTAWTLCLTHFFGNILAEVNISESNLDTLTFRELLHIKDVVTHDTIELFYDMQTYNKYTTAMRNKVQKSLGVIIDRIERSKKDRKIIK
jgi:prephenate dehydrogenase